MAKLRPLSRATAKNPELILLYEEALEALDQWLSLPDPTMPALPLRLANALRAIRLERRRAKRYANRLDPAYSKED